MRKKLLESIPQDHSSAMSIISITRSINKTLGSSYTIEQILDMDAELAQSIALYGKYRQ